MAVKCIANCGIRQKADTAFLGIKEAEKVRAYHATFPEYKATPLHSLAGLASKLGVGKIFIKDESYRFGLNAFKVLGGSYAVGRYIGERIGIPETELSYDRIASKDAHNALGDITFISATDGNHGRGVAWAAHRLGQKSVIYMPKGSSQERFENIKTEHSDVTITDLNYDDAVRKANREAEEKGWVLVQDTSWPGYEKIPRWIMQGYTTMSLEIYEQLKGIRPTHIFLQAGVGSFASSVTGFFSDVYGGENKPIITVVEPETASCIYQTLQADDGQIHPVKGDMPTIMAGLACGEPVTVGIDVLRSYVDYCLAVSDSVSADGMRVLSSPVASDARIISGESGAAAFGAAYNLLTDEKLSDIKNRLKINENSVLLFISTEGATDRTSYDQIVWRGKYASL